MAIRAPDGANKTSKNNLFDNLFHRSLHLPLLFTEETILGKRQKKISFHLVSTIIPKLHNHEPIHCIVWDVYDSLIDKDKCSLMEIP